MQTDTIDTRFAEGDLASRRGEVRAVVTTAILLFGAIWAGILGSIAYVGWVLCYT